MAFYSADDRRRSKGFSLAIVLSILAHAVLLLVLFFGGSHPQKPKEPEKVITTVLVRQGKSERPKHLLPRKVTAPPPAPAPVVPTKKAAPVVKEEKKSPPKPQPNNTKSSKTTADRLSSLRRALAESNKPNDDEGEEDGDPEGTVSEAVQARLGNIYMSTVKNAVMPNFIMPNMVPAEVCANLPKAMVVIKVSQDGTIIASNLERSSGNSYFDNALVQAIRRTGIVPAPPSIIAERVRRDGIELYALCSHSL